MDPMDDPTVLFTYAAWILTLLLDTNDAATLLEDGDAFDTTFMLTEGHQSEDSQFLDPLAVFTSTIRNFNLWLPTGLCSADVEYWVTPRSTTWFSRFLMEQYDNERWLSMFRMTKGAMFHLTDLLKPSIEKQNTKYRFTIPIFVRVACTLFKLSHGANLTICSEFFAIGKSTVCKLLRDVVHAINDSLKHEMNWLEGPRMQDIQREFADLCSLPSVVGAIDGTHIPIAKPAVSAADYFYFKSGHYSINCQAVVDICKRFTNLFVGMLGSTNDSRMLRRSTLYSLANQGLLLNAASTMDGHPPVLLGDLGYPLLPWLMVPYKDTRRLSISEFVFNVKLRKGRTVVENALGILKSTFCELLVKIELSVLFVPDVILCCCLLHNVLLGQSDEDMQNLFAILHRERTMHTIEGGAQGDDSCIPPSRTQNVHSDDEVGDAEGVHFSSSDGDDDQPVANAFVVRYNFGAYLTGLQQSL